MIERYLLFGGYNYYPSGGWNDFQNSYADKEKAIAAAKNYAPGKFGDKWSEVIDKETGGLMYG